MPIAAFPGGGVRPRLLSVAVLSSTRIRAVFSEPISPASAPLAAFTLVALGGSTARTLTSILLFGPSFIEFSTSGILSTGSPAYRLEAATTVTDLAGNTIDLAFRQADVAVVSAASLLYTLSPGNSVNANGGSQLTLTRTGGAALPDGLYTIEFTTGSYSRFAIGEQRPNLQFIPALNGVLRFANPRGAPGAYTLTIRSVSGSTPPIILPAAVVFTEPSFYSKTYGHRRWFVPKFNTGPRSVEDEP